MVRPAARSRATTFDDVREEGAGGCSAGRRGNASGVDPAEFEGGFARRIDDLAAEGRSVYARPTVLGTNAGRFHGVPATDRVFGVGMFDCATVRDGKIVERIP